MVHVVTVFRRSRLDIAYGIYVVIEAITCLVFLDLLYDGTACLSNAIVVAVFTRDFVYSVARMLLGSRCFVGV